MATALEPTHGTGAFTGYLDVDADGRTSPGMVPNKIANSYTDFLASWTAQLAVLTCLIHRARTGQGMWIDLAMYQVGTSFMGEGLLDYAFNGRRTRRLGNRHETFPLMVATPAMAMTSGSSSPLGTTLTGKRSAGRWGSRNSSMTPDFPTRSSATAIRMIWTPSYPSGLWLTPNTR